jgi:hypothetical protein
VATGPYQARSTSWSKPRESSSSSIDQGRQNDLFPSLGFEPTNVGDDRKGLIDRGLAHNLDRRDLMKGQERAQRHETQRRSHLRRLRQPIKGYEHDLTSPRKIYLVEHGKYSI